MTKREDYSSLLNTLKEISTINYYALDNNELEDEELIINSLFCKYYCFAYAHMIGVRDNRDCPINRASIDQALSNYDVFNYFLNTCVDEYMLYDDIGTGKVVYVPYQPLADYFFSNPFRKEVLVNYVKNELLEKYNNEETKKRVK